ncbi:MAG: hypothetical protein AAFZ07_19900 [Actinomycetota bacterium]
MPPIPLPENASLEHLKKQLGRAVVLLGATAGTVGAVGGVLLAGMAFLVVFSTVLASLAFVVRAALTRSGQHLLQSSVLAIGALLMVLALPISVHRAESQNAWRDVDGDGMLDGFVNGSYDWLDINLSTFARTYLALTLAIAALAVLALRSLALRRAHNDEQSAITP